MPRTGRPATRHVAAVQRAVEVLNALGEARTELGTNEIARRTGVNVSSISRVLATLASGGLVDHVKSTGRYRLGLRLVQLANTAREGLDVRSLARPHLEELTELTGETATLSMPGTYEVITLDFAQSNLSVRSVAEVGRPSIAHATAVGKVFLAYGGTLPAGDLAAFTDRKVLDVEVERVRERGWGQAIGEREEDLNGIAVPILSRTNELVAILGIQGPANRFNPRAIRAAVDPLVEKAELIAAAL